MVGMRNETIISMRFVRSKLRKREESSHVVNNSEATQPTHVVSTVEPVGFRQSPSSVWHFPPLPPQPNLYIYNASSQVSSAMILKNIKFGMIDICLSIEIHAKRWHELRTSLHSPENTFTENIFFPTCWKIKRKSN